MATERTVPDVWQRFVRGLSPLGPVPRVVLDSWRRSSAAGVDPEVPAFRRVPAADLEQRLHSNHDLLCAAREEIGAFCAGLEVPHVVYLVDADGVVLHSSASQQVLADECGLHPGFDWSEKAMGTNGAGTALAAESPAAVIGCEHYCAAWHRAACLAAPVRAGSRVVGAVDLTTTLRDAAPFELAQVARLAARIERRLGGRSTPQEVAARADVLVVDDDADAREAAALFLSLRGLTVQTAGHAEDALVEAARVRPRVILLDVRLPGVDGIETCWRLKADPDTAHIPVVVLTGDATSAHEARASGCDGFLLKPVDPPEMLAVVREYLQAQP